MPDRADTSGVAPPSPPRCGWGWWVALAVAWSITLAAWTVWAAPGSLTGLAAVLPWLWLGLVGLALVAGRRARGVALVAGITFVGVWGRAWWAAPDRAGRGRSVTVLSWNLQRPDWQRPAERKRRMACYRGTIQTSGASVLALMEVDALDAQALGEALGFDCRQVDYRGTGADDRGGVAACARQGEWRLRRWARRRVVTGEDWYNGFAELESAAGGSAAIFNLLAVHLRAYSLARGAPPPDAVARSQRAAATELVEAVRRFHDPTIVAGDFNSPPDAAVHVALRRRLIDTWRRAAWGPGATAHLGPLPVRVDYIYATPDFRVLSSEILPVDCSDHRPVVARLELARRHGTH